MRRLASRVWEIPGGILGIAIGAVLYFVDWMVPSSVERAMRPKPD